METAKPRKKLQTVNVRLDDDMVNQLKKIAAQENRTVSNLIDTWLKECLRMREGK